MSTEANNEGATQLAGPFGLYRAEWLNDALFKLFTKPTYYPELETNRPCVLIGGRGTGKTTVLRCLSYDGRLALEKMNKENVPHWPYYGFYHRVNTNRVTAFKGSDLDPEQWVKAYSHYLNLLMCGQLAEFLNWFSSIVEDAEELSPESCRDITQTLLLEPVYTQFELARGCSGLAAELRYLAEDDQRSQALPV